MTRIILLLLLAASLGGCSSPPQPLSPDVLYIRSIDLDVNGTPANGTLVAPRKDKYQITIKSKGNMDLLLIKSCHREWYGEKISGRGWFQNNSSYVYQYAPDPDLEMHECPLEISSLDATKGAHAWGYIDFEDPKYILPVTLQCNGSTDHYGGVSICQARAGLIQEIVFDTDVIAKPSAKCGLGNVAGTFLEGKRFVFEQPVGACFLTFMEKLAPRRMHRMTLIGYSDIVVMNQ